ncbi:MAG: E3 binding domain-containing protein, partial [Novosphingobium sp.]
ENAREALRLNSQLEAYRAYHTELTTELDELIADGASERRIATVQSQIANVRRLREFHGRMANERKQIDDLLASNEPGKIREGERRAAQYEQDLAQLKSMVERPVPEDMRRFIDERIEREDAAAKRAEEEAAAQSAPAQTAAADPAQTTPTAESPAPTAEAASAPTVADELPPASAAEPQPSAPRPDELGDLIPDDQPETQVRARTAIRDFAIENGVDITEVKPTGANGVVTRTDIKNHLETVGPSQSFIDADALVAEGIDTLQARFGNLPEVIDQFRANPRAIANFIINEKSITDPKLQRAINDYLDFSARGDPVPAEAQPIKFSESDRKRIRRRVSEIKRNNPDTPNLIAQHMAEQEAIRFRSESGPRTRSAQPAIERAANLPTAGRSNSGKIQSFLRPAATFNPGTEDEYSIAGRFTSYGGTRASRVGDIPTEGALSFEEAMVRASSQKPGHEHPVAFTADAPLRLADSRKPAQKGETVWADGRSGKAFRDWRNIYEKYYGYVPPETPSTIQSQLSRPSRDVPAAKLQSTGELVAALGRGEIDAAEFARRVSKLQAAGAPKPAAVDLPPLQRDDGKVALFVKKSGGSRRMATASDIADGLTAQDIIGSRSSIDDWHIFYVPADTPNTQVGKAMAERSSPAIQPEPKIPARGAIDYDKYQRITFHNSDLTPEDWRALEAAASLQKDPDAAIRYIGDIQSRDAGVTGQLLSRLINNIEGGQLRPFNKDSIHTSNWPSTDAGRRSMIRLLTQLYDLQTRMAPDGIALPAASREAAVADINRIFSSFGPEQLALAREAITNLNSAARPAFLRGGDDVAATETLSRTGDRVGSISFGKGFKAKRELPQIATLYHELAHWSYMNILTPAERLRVWDVMGNYYDEGGAFMPKEVARRSPLAKEAGKVYGPQNALNSPAEFFANQFAMRMMQRAELPDPEGMWSRVTRFVKAIFDRFFSRNSIDPDLEPFFARILPDEQRKAVEVQSYSDTPPITDLADLIPDEVIPETPAAPVVKSAKSVRERSPVERPAPTRDGPAEN